MREIEAMRKIERLKNSASASAYYHGHHLSRYKISSRSANEYVVGYRASATCVDCGMAVFVDSLPPPNGIDISGEAVALNCKGK